MELSILLEKTGPNPSRMSHLLFEIIYAHYLFIFSSWFTHMLQRSGRIISFRSLKKVRGSPKLWSSGDCEYPYRGCNCSIMALATMTGHSRTIKLFGFSHMPKWYTGICGNQKHKRKCVRNGLNCVFACSNVNCKRQHARLTSALRNQVLLPKSRTTSITN